MKYFLKLVEWMSRVPDWAVFILCPGIVLLFCILFVFVKGRKVYPAVAVLFGGLGGAVLFARGENTAAFCYLSLFAVLSALFSLLFLIPVRKGKGEKKTKISKADKMYEKFHEALSESGIPQDKMPPKVCCFEEPPQDFTSTKESGMSLAHADSLIARLRSASMSAGDRLELDACSKILDGYRNRPLTNEELRTVNDCLSTVLKLTAKYKL